MHMLRYALVGGVDTVRRQLEQFVAGTGVGEIMAVAAIR